MALVEVKGLSFLYKGKEAPALFDVSLKAEKGEFIVLCGMSGSGKSTLLKNLKPALAPHGKRCGEILFDGTPLKELSGRDGCRKIGFLMQNPESQIITENPLSEISFALENIGMKPEKIKIRIAELASYFNIAHLMDRPIEKLSGGEKQLVNLASVMALRPELLLLDEPTTRLDPAMAADFFRIIKKINEELSVTVIVSEHRLGELLPLADRIIALEHGQILFDLPPEGGAEKLFKLTHPLALALPIPQQVYNAASDESPMPCSLSEGRTWLERQAEKKPLFPLREENEAMPGKRALSIQGISFRYEKDGPELLKNLSFELNKGEIHCLLGPNGAGKSTLLSILAGILKPHHGKVAAGEGARRAILPQEPEALFIGNTLLEDLKDGARGAGDELQAKIDEAAELFDLKGHLLAHPYDLSEGEKQRAALAKLYLFSPDIYLLDEPTRGLDAFSKKKFAQILIALKMQGKSVFLISHDLDFVADVADKCSLLFDGAIISESSPKSFFAENEFYIPEAAKLARGIIPGAIALEDIIEALCGPQRGGDLDSYKEPPSNGLPGGWQSVFENCDTAQENEPSRKNMKKAQMLAMTASLILIPLTIYFGLHLFGERKYLLISLFVLLEAMIPFFLLFEGGRPKARELTLVSCLCAIAALGRAIFFMVPQFKPVTAIVIISGAAFGPQIGFLVGALTAFVSNFLFGQGTWTLFQMFAFSLIGFLSGFIFYGRKIQKNRFMLCAAGLFFTYVIYGGILNLSSLLTFQNYPSFEMILVYFIAALPFDLIHCTATVFFLYVLTNPLFKKFERLKGKYGLLTVNR